MEHRKFLISEFGPLAGMRVLGTGSLIAMPFAVSMLAEFGAEVIQIERPGVGDHFRSFPPVYRNEHGAVGATWVQDARNRLSMTLELNLGDPDVKEIFLGLIRESDVYIENMVWIEKLGIYDEELLAVNPKLVIVHVSGFGRKEFGGVPEICDQASYDMIGQCFSGFPLYNGLPDMPPLVAKPSLNDYITALFALFGTVAAYVSAQKTGKGQVVDISQFESQAKIMRDTFTREAMGFDRFVRSGSKAESFQPWDLFQSKDGIYVGIGAFGPNVFARFVNAVGFDQEKYTHTAVSGGKQAVDSPLGREFDALVRAWCAEHTAEEIEKTMIAAKVPCSRVNDPAACMSHPQFLLRDDFISYEDQTIKENVTAFGVYPKMSGTPGQIWRGAPALGQDTEAILKEILGYSSQKIAKLREKNVI